jgi:hypothetical protein
MVQYNTSASRLLLSQADHAANLVSILEVQLAAAPTKSEADHSSFMPDRSERTQLQC